MRNEHSWNNNASVIFIDQPVNVGFSYTNSNTSDTTLAASDDIYGLLTLFFNTFPEYAEVDFHIAGESYAGHYIPGIAHKIVTTEGNTINLKSILAGNGLTDPLTQYAYYRPMACGEGGYDAVLGDSECKAMDDALPECQSLIQGCYDDDLQSCLSAYDTCNEAMLNPYGATGSDMYDIRPNQPVMEYGSDEWLNKQEVRDALGVEVDGYEMCDDPVYNAFIGTGDWMRPSHRAVPDILAKIPVLIYAGDADFICNWLGNRAWTKALEWPGKDAYNAAEVQALTLGDRHYGNLTTAENFAFIQIFEAGHMAPAQQPEATLDMLNRWIGGEWTS